MSRPEDTVFGAWEILIPHIPNDLHMQLADKVVNMMESCGCDMDWDGAIDDPLSIANRKLYMHQNHGTPRYPVEGDTHICGDTLYRWDGFEWVEDGED